MGASQLYNKDFFAWANEQAALLRNGKLAAADIEHIAEEIESMGKTEKRELISRLTILLLHLFKWRFQPTLRSVSWRNTIRGQRIDIADLLEDNPSLKSLLPAATAKAHIKAVGDAEAETGLPISTFPSECPWTFEQIMMEGFWPD